MNCLKELRIAYNLSQTDIGKILNVQKSAVSKYETGRSLLSEDTINKLCDYFNISADELLGRKEFKQKISSNSQIQKSLTKEHQRVLDYYDRLSEEDQDLIRGTMVQLYKDKEVEISSEQIS